MYACCPSLHVALSFLSRIGNPEYQGSSFPYWFYYLSHPRNSYHNWPNIPYSLGIFLRSFILEISSLTGYTILDTSRMFLYSRPLFLEYSYCSALSLPNRLSGPMTSPVIGSTPWSNNISCHWYRARAHSLDQCPLLSLVRVSGHRIARRTSLPYLDHGLTYHVFGSYLFLFGITSLQWLPSFTRYFPLI